MFVKRLLVLSAAALLVAGAAGAADRGQQERSATAVSDRSEARWEFHKEFDHKCDAVDECDRLRRMGFDARWKQRGHKFVVEKRSRR